MIGRFDRRITVKKYTTSGTDDYGSPIKNLESSWPMWANVENRSGSFVTGQGQQIWTYDYKVTVRLEKSREIKSNMLIEYEDGILSINEVSVGREGRKDFYVLRCSKTDGNIS